MSTMVMTWTLMMMMTARVFLGRFTPPQIFLSRFSGLCTVIKETV